jgi:hypothetical protein
MPASACFLLRRWRRRSRRPGPQPRPPARRSPSPASASAIDQAWYVTKTRALPTGGGFDRAKPLVETIDDARVRPPAGAAGSRLTSGRSSRLVHVLILADANVVAGQETYAIGELLAFLALAQTPVAEECGEAPTILNLMNPACPPERRPAALTDADLAYLRARYSSDPEAGERLQRGNIVQHMTNELTGDR